MHVYYCTHLNGKSFFAEVYNFVHLVNLPLSHRLGPGFRRDHCIVRHLSVKQQLKNVLRALRLNGILYNMQLRYILIDFSKKVFVLVQDTFHGETE